MRPKSLARGSQPAHGEPVEPPFDKLRVSGFGFSAAPPEPKPSVAVIIPAYNAAATLSACLAALRNEGIPGLGGQLVVVDDGSTDRTAAIAEGAGALVLRSERRGPAAARNLGARNVGTDYLVFLDADTAPEPGWLAAMLAPFTDPDIVAVKGRYVRGARGEGALASPLAGEAGPRSGPGEGGSLVARFAQLEFEEKYARLRAAPAVDFVDTGTGAYRREVLLCAGGFDESFPAQSAEDVELAFRLAAQGARFAFADAARVRHTYAAGLGAFLYKKARYGYFRAAVYRRHPTKLGGDSYTPRWMALQIASAGLIPAAALGAALWPGLWAMAAAAAATFLATCWPLLRRAWLTDRGLILWVAPLAYLRAFAQGLGLGLGLAALLAGRHLPAKPRKAS